MDFVKVLLFNIVAMPLCYLLLVEGAGWHYFHKYENENLTIPCNLSIGQNMSVCWYNHFSQNISNCGVSSLMVPNRGGIFECRKEDKKNTSCSLQCNNASCNSCSTFIISSDSEQETHINQKSLTININNNTNLSCSFNRNNLNFISFWVAVYPNGSNRCLFSLDNDYNDFNSNTYCHSIIGVGQNRINFFNLTNHTEAIQKQHLEIKKAQSSDSGIYLCFHFIWSDGKLKFKLGSNISLEVRDPKDGQNIFIGVGTAGGIIITSALILMFLCIKKSRKNKMKQQRNPDTVDWPNDYECTPYAISDRKDMEKNPNSHYLVVTEPKQAPEADYSEMDITPTGADLCVAYSVVNLKQR